MSLQGQKLIRQLKGFQNVMKKVFRNKKATAGLIILVAFTFLAIFGPVFITDDPIHPGSVTVGRMPVAAVSAYPGWYRDFTGNPRFTDNVYVTRDAKFSDPNGLRQWKNTTTNSGITVSYNSENSPVLPGYEPAKGSLQVSFGEEGNATLSIQFYYPYSVPPKEYSTEWSYSVQTQNQTGQPGNITIFAYFSRSVAGGEKVFPAAIPLRFSAISRDWAPVPYHYLSSVNSLIINQYGQDPDPLMFPNLGLYTFQMTVQFSGNATASGNPEVFLGNLDLVLFGNSFGLLGTDNLARDLFTQLIAGTRVSFIIGIVSAVVSVALGLIVGLIAGYIGGATDEVLMRLTDMLLVIPFLPLTIVLIFVLGQSMLNIIVVVGFLGWMGFARTVRSAILSLKERSFIEAVRSAGGGRFYIIRKHLVPNVFPLVYITLAMSVPGAIVTEAALSWLGLGPQDVMSWGRMLYQYEQSGQVATGAFTTWYWTIPPGICIALLSLSFILIGYALDEILNPRLRER
jgi:peptide/nickel transport system permease protein